jgi:dipeptidyl aminopeptidase/acylaminoacyl peptidase
VQYTTRDGVPIPAYLAKPEGAGPFPTILMPHGGPYARDSAEFDAWTQFLVGHGFAVLKPNYRGSVGYGEAYMQAGYKQWGQKMQEDLMDGLDWMVQQGITDPQRVCIVGASYGGYTALVSAYKFADKISCAVSLAGISNLEDMVARIYSFDLVERNRERIQASAQLAENSPIRQVTSIDVPILLMHGNRDTVVRVRQSRKFAAALARHGKTFRYVEQENGDHFLSTTSQRDEFFSEMSRFLTEHLAPVAR